ncbi:hypothetical protein [Marinobacter sp.]|uniref:hypothetical protein n=1 Tax=Marinobacter sp. TaxID=50741 RepID=UPI0035630101
MPLSAISKENATEDQISFLETEFAGGIYAVGGLFYEDEKGFLYPGFKYPYSMNDGTELTFHIGFKTVSGETPISADDTCIVMLEVPDHSISTQTASSVLLRKMMSTPNAYIVYAAISTVLAENGSIDLLARIEREMIDDLLVDDMADVDPDDLRDQVWRAHK